MTLVRRYRRDTNELGIPIEVSRGRSFSFCLPEGVPYDNEDADNIVKELEQLDPRPDEIQAPVPDGLGGLVYDMFVVTFWDSRFEDYEHMLDIEDAVKRGLRNRAWAF